MVGHSTVSSARKPGGRITSSPEAIERVQDERLRAMLALCARGHPYYRRRWQEAGIDIAARRLDVQISQEEMNARLRQWAPPAPRYTSGVMAKYAKLVSSASQGAVTL